MFHGNMSYSCNFKIAALRHVSDLNNFLCLAKTLYHTIYIHILRGIQVAVRHSINQLHFYNKVKLLHKTHYFHTVLSPNHTHNVSMTMTMITDSHPLLENSGSATKCLHSLTKELSVIIFFQILFILLL